MFVKKKCHVKATTHIMTNYLPHVELFVDLVFLITFAIQSVQLSHLSFVLLFDIILSRQNTYNLYKLLLKNSNKSSEDVSHINFFS